MQFFVIQTLLYLEELESIIVLRFIEIIDSITTIYQIYVLCGSRLIINVFYKHVDYCL